MPRKLKKKAKPIYKAKKKAVKSKAVKKKVKKTTVTRKKVTAIPKGYNSITPYLIVDNGAKAIEFYKQAFGAKEVMRMEKPDGKIGHAELKFGDTKIMLADEFPEMGARAPKAYQGSPVGIHLYIKNVDGVIANALSLGAKLIRPASNMFYGDRIGCIEDPFGHKWYVSTHIENVTVAQIKKRAAALHSK